MSSSKPAIQPKEAKNAQKSKQVDKKVKKKKIAKKSQNGSKTGPNRPKKRSFQVFLTGLSGRIRQRQLLKHLKAIDPDVKSVALPKRASTGYAFVTLKDEKSMKNLLSKKSILFKGRELQVKEYARDKEELTKARKETNGRRVFVSNIPNSVEDVELKNEFLRFGKVDEAYLIRDRGSGRGRRFGYVLFGDSELAEMVASLKKVFLRGKRKEVSVKMHRPREAKSGGDEGSEGVCGDGEGNRDENHENCRFWKIDMGSVFCASGGQAVVRGDRIDHSEANIGFNLGQKYQKIKKCQNPQNGLKIAKTQNFDPAQDQRGSMKGSGTLSTHCSDRETKIFTIPENCSDLPFLAKDPSNDPLMLMADDKAPRSQSSIIQLFGTHEKAQNQQIAKIQKIDFLDKNRIQDPLNHPKDPSNTSFYPPFHPELPLQSRQRYRSSHQPQLQKTSLEF